MKTILIGAAVLLAGTPALAQAAPPAGVAQGTAPVTAAPAPHMEHVRIHMMSDKVMTRDEVVAHVRRMFQDLDANHDGFVTRDELDSIHQRMMGMHEGMAKEMAERGIK